MYSSSPHLCCMSYLFHLPWLVDSNYTWWRVQAVNLMSLHLSLVHRLLSASCSQTPWPMFISLCQRPRFWTNISKQYQNSISSQFPYNLNSDLLLSIPNSRTVLYLKLIYLPSLCHDSSMHLVTRQQHILSLLCI
jgi:hypothetical protein